MTEVHILSFLCIIITFSCSVHAFEFEFVTAITCDTALVKLATVHSGLYNRDFW